MTTTSVGVRELKANPSKYLRIVQDERREIDVTIRGEVVARLVPVKRMPSTEELDRYWERHRKLAERIGTHWPEGVSAVEAVREQRREL
jgi:prevent-host-death family protein